MQASKYAIVAVAMFAVIVFGYFHTSITGNALVPSDKAVCGNGWCETQAEWIYIHHSTQFCNREITLTNVSSCKSRSCDITLDVEGESKVISKYGPIRGIWVEVKATLQNYHEELNRAFVVFDEEFCCLEDCTSVEKSTNEEY